MKEEDRINLSVGIRILQGTPAVHNDWYTGLYYGRPM